MINYSSSHNQRARSGRLHNVGWRNLPNSTGSYLLYPILLSTGYGLLWLAIACNACRTREYVLSTPARFTMLVTEALVRSTQINQRAYQVVAVSITPISMYSSRALVFAQNCVVTHRNPTSHNNVTNTKHPGLTSVGKSKVGGVAYHASIFLWAQRCWRHMGHDLRIHQYSKISVRANRLTIQVHQRADGSHWGSYQTTQIWVQEGTSKHTIERGLKEANIKMASSSAIIVR